jgi:hypothetical protein
MVRYLDACAKEMTRNGWDAEYLFGGRGVADISPEDLRAAVDTLTTLLGCVSRNHRAGQ